jgi:hypothetical protein
MIRFGDEQKVSLRLPFLSRGFNRRPLLDEDSIVPRLWRSHGRAGAGGIMTGFRPRPSGWADVERAAVRALMGLVGRWVRKPRRTCTVLRV